MVTLQVSFSGCLIENLNSLANHSHIYSPGWNQKYMQGMNSLTTSGGFPKLDFVSFTYHHALTTLIDRSVQRSSTGEKKAIFCAFSPGMPWTKR